MDLSLRERDRISVLRQVSEGVVSAAGGSGADRRDATAFSPVAPEVRG